jgi:subtilisin family serine protease
MNKKLLSVLLALAFLLNACNETFDLSNKLDRIKSGRENVSGSQAPIFLGATGQAIKDSYIIVLKDDVQSVDNEVAQMSASLGGVKPDRVFKNAIKGFSIKLPEVAVQRLLNNPKVKYIEQDQLVSIGATQSNATWGLDRVDQKDLPLNSSYTYFSNGSTVDAYIIDTGIRPDHNEFSGRVVSGYDAFGGNTADGNGHGTHVAGTVGGTTYGIAKEVRLIAVRVLDNSGSGAWSGVIAGVDWVVADHAAGKPAVANMSLGGGISTALNDAVRKAVADGVVMVVAAGNSNANAANYSPASTVEAITVGATTSSDARASYSNFGSVLDIFAPGSSITSAWITSNSSINTISGTSMAAPHVAGVAALYLEAKPGSTPAQVDQGLKAFATVGKVTSAGTGSPNLLLYSGDFSITPAPLAPSLISPANNASGVSSTTVNVSWSAASGATSYKVELSTSNAFTTLAKPEIITSNTSASFTALSTLTTYYWRVVASNASGATSSAIWSFTTALPAPVLGSPADKATNVTRTPTLSWSAVTGAATYDVQVATRSNFSSSSLVVNVNGLVNTSFTSTTALRSRTTHFWRVRSRTSNGTLSAWSSSRSFTTQ